MLFVKHAPDTLTYTMQTIQRQWTADEIPVLQAALSVPQCTGDRPGRTARRLSRYYRQCTEAFLRYCSRELYPRALAEFEGARRAGAPLPCARAALECTVACNERGVFSTYLDCTEWAGTKDALTLRRADTWDLRTGAPISAGECFPRGVSVRRACLQAARAQCAGKGGAAGRCAGHLPARLRRHLNLRSFYLTPESFCFFYQPYAISLSGTLCPTFTIPFSEGKNGPFWPLSAT